MFVSLFLLIVVFAVGLVFALLVVLAKNGSLSQTPPPDLTDAQIYGLTRNGKKILAIKWYRHLHGVDLKTATEAVERMLR